MKSQRLVGLFASSCSSSRLAVRRGIATSASSHAQATASTSSSSNNNNSPASTSRSNRSSKSPKSTTAPTKLPSPFEDSLTHVRTYGHHVCTLQLLCYGVSHNVENLDMFTDFALRSAYALGMPCTRPASLPVRTSLWTTPRGPFVHKKAQENFTRTTHARILKVYDAHADVVETWLHWCRIHAIAGVGMRAQVYRHYPLNLASTMAASATKQLQERPKSAASSPAPSAAAMMDMQRADAEGALALEKERKSVEAASTPDSKQRPDDEETTKPSATATDESAKEVSLDATTAENTPAAAPPIAEQSNEASSAQASAPEDTPASSQQAQSQGNKQQEAPSSEKP